LRTSENPQKAKFAEFFTCELRRIPILGRWAILSATRVSFLYLSGGSNRSILSGFCSRFSSVGSLRSRLHSCLTSVVKSHNRADQAYERRQENCPNHRFRYYFGLWTVGLRLFQHTEARGDLLRTTLLGASVKIALVTPNFHSVRVARCQIHRRFIAAIYTVPY
jgi:hypothetical protein